MQKESVVVGESMNTQHIAEPEQLEADRKQIGLNWQLDMILKNINAGVSASCVDIDGTTHYIYANDKFYQIYGYTKEQFETELKGSTQELIVPAYYEKVQEKMQYAAEHMETVQFDYQAYKRNGSVAWIRVKVAVCHMDEQEQPVYVTIYNDISKEKKTAKRIRELNEKLSNCEIFVQLNIIEKRVEEFQSVYVTSKDSIRFIEDQNQYERYMKEVAYEEEYEIVYDALSYKGLMQHYRDGDMKYSVEYRRKMPSGEIRWFAATAVLIEDSAEEIVNAFIYSRDIDTKMKRRIARNQIVDADVEDITIINIAHKTCQVIEQK